MTASRLVVLGLGLALAACTPRPTPAPISVPPPATGSAPPPVTGGGAICGTRGVVACPADQFCSFALGASCGATDMPGHCMTAPKICPHLVNPVCGCDGKTYNNDCEASRAGTGLAAGGACK